MIAAHHQPAHRTRSVDAHWLADDVYACITEGGTVLLDARRGRYFAVGIPETQTLTECVADWPRLDADVPASIERVPPKEEDLLAHLCKARLLQRTPRRIPTHMAARVSLDHARGLLDERWGGTARVRPRDVARFLYACAWARSSLKFRSIEAIAREVESWQGRAALESSGDTLLDHLAEVTRRFQLLRTYAFSAKDQCLLDALALRKFLHCYQLRARWVIGVRMRPWGAHSWVQHQHWLLSGTPEQVLDFTPILTV